MAVLWFYVGGPPDPNIVTVVFIGAAVFAFLESIRSGLDDNIVAAIPTAFALQALAYVHPPVWVLGNPSFNRVAIALLVNVVLALATWAIRLVRPSGAVAGAIVGTLIVLYGGWAAYGLLWTFFSLGTAATKLGYSRKAGRGVAEPQQGRRGASHVLANCSVALACLALNLRWAPFVAAFAAALSDSLGTEIGTLLGRRAFSPLSFRQVPVGTPGGVSVPGTLASLAGALAMALAAWALHVLHPSVIWLVTLSGWLGAFGESVLSSLGQRFGFRLDHDFANGLNTFLGAVLCYVIGWTIYPLPR